MMALWFPAISLSGAEVLEKTTTLGFKAGLYSPGTAYLNDFEGDTDMSYMIGGFLDYMLAEKISGGAVLELANVSAYDESSTLIQLGFSLKAWVYGEEETFIFRPGFGLAYGSLGGNDAIDGTSHLILNGYAEFLIPRENSMTWLVELGITGSVNGGNDDVDLTYGPGFTIRGGLVF